MAKKPKVGSKSITLSSTSRFDVQKLAELQAEGWQIISQHKRGLAQWKPGQIDYVLTRTTGGEPQPQSSPAPPPPPTSGPPAGWYPDPHGRAGVQRYWDGAAWTDHVHQG